MSKSYTIWSIREDGSREIENDDIQTREEAIEMARDIWNRHSKKIHLLIVRTREERGYWFSHTDIWEREAR